MKLTKSQVDEIVNEISECEETKQHIRSLLKRVTVDEVDYRRDELSARVERLKKYLKNEMKTCAGLMHESWSCIGCDVTFCDKRKCMEILTDRPRAGKE